MDICSEKGINKANNFIIRLPAGSCCQFCFLHTIYIHIISITLLLYIPTVLDFIVCYILLLGSGISVKKLYTIYIKNKNVVYYINYNILLIY